MVLFSYLTCESYFNQNCMDKANIYFDKFSHGSACFFHTHLIKKKNKKLYFYYAVIFYSFKTD